MNILSEDDMKFIPTEYNVCCDGIVLKVIARDFDSDNRPLFWSIFNGKCALSRKTGQFDLQPKPSARSSKWIDEHRFGSLIEVEYFLERVKELV